MRTIIEQGEEIVFQVNKHWLMLLRAAVVLMFAVAVRVFPYLDELLSIVLSAAGVLLSVYFYYDWKWNIWVITSRRVIDEWGVFTRNFKETPLDTVQNVSYHQSLMGRIFGYGDVSIQSAASEGSTVNTFISKPDQVKTAITKTIRHKDNADTKECPFCAELIKVGANKCRYCGEVLEENE